MARRIALGIAATLLVAGCGTAARLGSAVPPGGAKVPGTAPAGGAASAGGLAARDWQSYFPGQVGHTWQYRTVAHPTDDPYVDYPGTHTVRVEASRQEAGRVEIDLREIDSYTTRYRFPRLIASPAGVDLVGVDYWGPVATAIDSLSIPLLRFPLAVGSRWDDGAWMGKVIKEERVTVPAGTFDTVKLDVIGTHDQAYTAVGYYWLARGVGVVKSDYSIEGWLIETELTSASRR